MTPLATPFAVNACREFGFIGQVMVVLLSLPVHFWVGLAAAPQGWVTIKMVQEDGNSPAVLTNAQRHRIRLQANFLSNLAVGVLSTGVVGSIIALVASPRGENGELMGDTASSLISLIIVAIGAGVLLQLFANRYLRKKDN